MTCCDVRKFVAPDAGWVCLFETWLRKLRGSSRADGHFHSLRRRRFGRSSDKNSHLPASVVHVGRRCHRKPQCVVSQKGFRVDEGRIIQPSISEDAQRSPMGPHQGHQRSRTTSRNAVPACHDTFLHKDTQTPRMPTSPHRCRACL